MRRFFSQVPYWVDAHLVYFNTPQLISSDATLADYTTHERDILVRAFGHGCLRDAAGLLPVRVSLDAVAPEFSQRYDSTVLTEDGHRRGDG